MRDLHASILEAHRRLRPEIAFTPLLHSPGLSAQLGCAVHLKCEHLQHTGSFKFRGASNKLRLLAEGGSREVITASTGNHGLAVALAGKQRGIDVTVYAAASTSPVKLDAIRSHGAELVLLESEGLEVELTARRAAKDGGVDFISPYNDLDVVAGQGTIGAELAEQMPELDAVFVSVGGGGLASGIGTALRGAGVEAQIVGCWPANARCLHDSIEAGRIVEVEERPTLSDGTAGGLEPDSVTLSLSTGIIDRKILVDEPAIAAAMRDIARYDRWMVEGAAGVALAGAAALAGDYRDARIAIILCGRNVALETFLKAVG